MAYNNESTEANLVEFPVVTNSPIFTRAKRSFGLCLRFRYQLFGPGSKTLEIYQKLYLQDERQSVQLVWRLNKTNSLFNSWEFGQVHIPGITKYKV